jgi:hypothetical protein
MRAPARTLRGAGKGCFKLADGLGVKDLDLQSDGRRCTLDVRGHSGRIRPDSGIDQQRKAHCVRQQVVHQPDPFCPQLGVRGGDAGDVAAGLVEGSNESRLHRIAAGGEHDGDGGRCLLGRD